MSEGRKENGRRKSGSLGDPFKLKIKVFKGNKSCMYYNPLNSNRCQMRNNFYDGKTQTKGHQEKRHKHFNNEHQSGQFFSPPINIRCAAAM